MISFFSKKKKEDYLSPIHVENRVDRNEQIIEELDDEKFEKVEETDGKSKLEFRDLPFRIVIFDILSQIEIYLEEKFAYQRIRGKGNVEFELFGYFTRDVTRKIFLVFSAIIIKNWNFPIMSVFHLVHLEVYPSDFKKENKKQTDSFIEHACNFSSLEILNLRLSGNDSYDKNEYVEGIFSIDDWAEIFSTPGCFPKLKNLIVTLDYGIPIVDASNWHTAEHMWRNLKSLQLEFIRYKEDLVPFVTHQHYFKNLERIFLRNHHFSKNVNISLPRIRKLWLYNCSKVTISTTPSSPPVSLQLLLLPLEDMKNNIIRIENIKDISLQLKEEDVNEYEFMNEFMYSSKIRYVQSYEICDVTLKNDDEKNEANKLPGISGSGGDNIMEKIKLTNTVFFNHSLGSLKSCSFGRLKYLELDNLTLDNEPPKYFDGNVVLPFSQSLEVLIISKISCVTDMLFRKNFFPQLRKLSIGCCNLIEGKNWKTMPKLEDLDLSGNFVDDVLFQFPIFPSLKYLKVSCYNKISVRGIGWDSKNMNKLRTLDISHCVHFENEIFLKNGFEHLEEIRMYDCLNFSGGRWVGARSLKKLYISNSERLEDSFFQENSFPALEILSIYNMMSSKNLKGVGWSTFPSLKILAIVESLIGDELFQKENLMKEIREITLYNCKNIRRENWCVMKSIRAVGIKKCSTPDTILN